MNGNEDDEIVQAFLEESRENLDQLDRDLVELEERPSDPELLAQVFRTIHTIKATCGFLGYHRLEALTHVGEDLLDALRTGELIIDQVVTTSLLGLIDAVRRTLLRIEVDGEEGDEDHAVVMRSLGEHLRTDDGVPRSPDMVSGASPPIVDGPPATVAMVVETSVRVDVTVLDKLLHLVGELVLVKGRIGELTIGEEDGPLALPYRDLQLLTAELQDGVMRARLQPVGTVIGKFRRIARDLATHLDKQVHVELDGESVGVDKAVNEALRDPLLHLVRNVLDHGIETPAERVAVGKPPEGRLRIRAYHEGDRMRVEMSDDGRGVDVAGLVRHTVASGELSPEDASRLTRAEQLELMFLPGLSASDEVTEVSGRGVGMDAVRANLHLVGGTIDVWSEEGRGTTFRINVPLTLAILPSVLIWCASRRYAVPQADVHEIVHLDPDEVARTVDDVDGALVHRLRGRLLPLVELSARLAEPPATGDGSLTIVVVARDGRRFGLVVDGVGDTAETVAKPLPEVIRSIPVFSGVTILGDGQPALILDVAGLATDAGIEGDDDDTAQAVPVADAERADRSSLVLASGGQGGRLAFRLAAVQRLEQFPATDIHRLGTREVAEYLGTILPLVRVSDVLDRAGTIDAVAGRADQIGLRQAAPSTVVDVVVCDSAAGPVGLIVDGIEDVIAEPAVPPQPGSRRGIAACLLVDDGVTELVDIDVLVGDAGLGRTA